VGEIRDEDTAQMALRAAMTGHQVYSTLHSNNAIGAIPRLVDIGISTEIMAGNIIGIVAQRLVRRLCKHCRQPYEAKEDEWRILGVKSDKPPAIYRAVGCDHCEYQGFRGRLAIMELLKIDAELDEMMAHRATAREMLAAAMAKGFRTLADDGLRRVLDGSTSLDELMRVIEDVVRDHVEEAVVLPVVSPGFTDSRVFRRRGITAYGFIPILLEPLEAATIHGHNERISIDNLRLGTQILFEVTRRLCT